MTDGFSFHPEAMAELVAGVDWYDERELALGERFESSVRDAVQAALEAPDSWPVWSNWQASPLVRSKMVGGFPYRVVYFVQEHHLTVVAVAHAKRRPHYWIDRTDSR